MVGSFKSYLITYTNNTGQNIEPLKKMYLPEFGLLRDKLIIRIDSFISQLDEYSMCLNLVDENNNTIMRNYPINNLSAEWNQFNRRALMYLNKINLAKSYLINFEPGYNILPGAQVKLLFYYI